MRKYVLPALILCLFVLESISIDIFNIGSIHDEWIIVPRYVLITVILCAIYTGPYIGMIFGMFFGFLYDVVYTDILGVYLFAYPIAAYFVSKIMKVLQANIFIAYFMILLAIAIVEYLVYGIHFLIGSTNMMQQEFLSSRLLPTLGYNGIIAIIFIYPLRLFMEQLAIEQKDDL
ncbi:rod shape-determining protein MreD [Sutcliffiella deserti]|uniref:rod shape-determining protein MreD n=1 Tax=Sutcliffiella deserti TaxID=2875501 RepID=UPI001CBE3DD2|nr:rod shape-determining protein MreD [Sutcliffiella deserti]